MSEVIDRDEKKSWHDLYYHGRNLDYLVRSYRTQYKHAEKRGDINAMQWLGEAQRKVEMNCVEVAKTVLQVEAIVKGKKVYA